jgi:hypothetical protein
MARVLHVTRQFTDKEMKTQQGKFSEFDPETYTLITENTDVYREKGVPLLRFRKKVIPDDLCNIAIKSFKSVASMTSSNRGFAAGSISTDHVRRIVNNRFERSTPVHSIVAGYIDSLNWSRPCRLTAFSRDNLEKYTMSQPFFKAIDKNYKDLFPENHAAQSRAAEEAKEYRVADTVFSTITVNHNFRTALHTDKGDFKQGMGNLVVAGSGYTGGYLLFPQYLVAVDVCQGDFLGMDVHQYHANSAINLIDIEPNAFRLSFVCYWRNNMSSCHRLNEIMGTKKSTEDMIKDIVGDNATRVELGEGSRGQKWYKLETTARDIIFYNKQYTIIDKTQPEHKIYKNLHLAHRYCM